MSDWKKWKGSDEQIAEMRNCKNGFLLRSSDHMYENEIIYADADLSCIDAFNVTEYLICNPHPLAAKFIQWINTGQPVWVRVSYYDPVTDISGAVTHKTNTPDWNIPNAEYRFTPFEEEVCKEEKR